MIWLFIGLIVVLVLLPGWWVRYTLRKYSVDYPELPGTGGQLAEHFIQKLSLPITVEITDQGDHYDPKDKVVRLSESFFNGRSLSAVAVATHEVGHAIQDHVGYKPLKTRTKLAKAAQLTERIGAWAFVALPIVGVFVRSPVVMGLVLLIAVINMFAAVIVHLVTLPVEWDASFGRALPLLKEGEYLTDGELKVAKKVLTAAALTYVAGALLSLLSVWRWIAILRR